MVGSTLFSRPLGGLLHSRQQSYEEIGNQSYEEIVLDDDDDDDDDDEEYYEEVIVEDEDGEEYIEEIIEDDDGDMNNSDERTKEDDRNLLVVTQEQVDSMSFQNAKNFLRAAKQGWPTLVAPTTQQFSDDDDYEYEEIEMPDHISPIQYSSSTKRFSFFEAPDLDLIMEESCEWTSDRSGANSTMTSPAGAPKRSALEVDLLSNISEGIPGIECEGHLLPAQVTAGAGKDGDKTKGKVSLDGKEDDLTNDLPKGSTILLGGGLNDNPKPGSSTRSISRSNKSIHSEGTETTYCESVSNTSLNPRQQVFVTPPPASPELSSNLRRHPDSARREVSEKKEPSTPCHKSASTLGSELSKLGNSSAHSSSRRRSSGSRRCDDNDDDNHSTRSGKSRRSSSGRSGSRRSLTKSLSEDRALSVEEEILQLLSPEKEEKKKKTSSLEAMLSPGSSRPRERGDSDSMSRSSAKSYRSSARRRSLKGRSSDKSQSTEQSSIRRGSSRRTESPTKESSKKIPTLKEGSKTLDNLLACLPSKPGKRSDAKSTASGMLRSSRGRTRDSRRDSQSVVGNSTSCRRPSRARSARRTKKTGDDDVSVASMPAMGRKVRSRSSSVGRKERLRRGRQRDEVDKASRRYQQETRTSSNSPKDEKPNSQRNDSRYSSSRRPSSSTRSRNNSFDESDIIEPGSLSGDDKLRSPRQHSRRASSGRRRTSGGQRLGSSDGHQRPRSSSDRSSSSKSSHDDPRSARTLDDKNGSLDDTDDSSLFSRILKLARSLDDSTIYEDDEEPAPPKTPTNRKSHLRASSDDTRSPSNSHVRRSPGKGQSADDTLLYDPDESDKRHSSQLSSVASSMQDFTYRPPNAAPTKDKDYRRESPKKQRSSDDAMLAPGLGSSMDDYNQEEPRTPGGSKTRRPPGCYQYSRHRTSSSGKLDYYRHTYHSPRKSLKTPVARSTTEKCQVSPAQLQSDCSSPTQATQIGQAGRRRSDCSPPSQSSSLPSPKNRRKLMEMSPTKSPHAVVPASPRRHSSMDMGSSTWVDSQSRRRRGGGAILTPFERLSELGKVKTFLTEEEYERKKKEILDCI